VRVERKRADLKGKHREEEWGSKKRG